MIDAAARNSVLALHDAVGRLAPTIRGDGAEIGLDRATGDGLALAAGADDASKARAFERIDTIIPDGAGGYYRLRSVSVVERFSNNGERIDPGPGAFVAARSALSRDAVASLSDVPPRAAGPVQTSRLAARRLFVPVGIAACCLMAAIAYLPRVQFNRVAAAASAAPQDADLRRAPGPAAEAPTAAVQPPPSMRMCKLAQPDVRIVAVARENTAVLSAPSDDAEAALDAAGAARIVDPRFDLAPIEERGAWVQVRTVAPAWPAGAAGWTGWVRKTDLLAVHSEDQKKCLFVDPSSWPSLTQEQAGAVRTAALRLLATDARCDRIAGGGPTANPSRFYLTCYPTDGGRAYHYWFSPNDVASLGAEPRPAQLSESDAIHACRQEIRAASLREGSGSYLAEEDISIDDIEIQASAPAYKLTMTFRARSGSETRQRKASCLVPPNGRAEIVLTGRARNAARPPA